MNTTVYRCILLVVLEYINDARSRERKKKEVTSQKTSIFVHYRVQVSKILSNHCMGVKRGHLVSRKNENYTD